MIYTIGHSVLPKEEFLRLIRGKVDTVIDVRSHPNSKWPHFRKESLEKWLPEAGIGYEWWPELGGWDARHLPLVETFPDVDLAAYAKGKFPKQRIAKNAEPPAEQLALLKPQWTNIGLRDYASFTSLDEFLEGADRLMARGESGSVGIMCCEVLPWKCHRSMISDYLAFRQVDSVHMQPKPKAHSQMLGNRLERYSVSILEAWKAWKGI